MLVCKEFRDGFTPCASLTTSDGVLVQTFTLQYIDSINDNDVCTCSVTLVHGNKDNMLTEHTCIDEMNERKDPEPALKIYSKKHGACILIVLQYTFIILHQLEKRVSTLFTGGNIDWGGATYS